MINNFRRTLISFGYVPIAFCGASAPHILTARCSVSVGQVDDLTSMEEATGLLRSGR